MLEREMKFLLEKEQFYTLLKWTQQAYPGIQPKEINQTNYYYDTDDLRLYKQHITLRVRGKNDKYAIEKKEVEGYEGLIRKARESKYPVEHPPEEIRAADVEIEGDDVFHPLGQLSTRRTRFTLPDGTNIDFDVSEYFSVIDYEAEIELGDNPPKALIQKFSALQPENSAAGKLERFIRRLQ